MRAFVVEMGVGFCFPLASVGFDVKYTGFTSAKTGICVVPTTSHVGLGFDEAGVGVQSSRTCVNLGSSRTRNGLGFAETCVDVSSGICVG